MVDNATVVPGYVECQKKLDEYLTGWKRALADYQNLKKTVEDTKQMIGTWKDEAWVLDVLPVLDHFGQALKHIPLEAKDSAWVQGMVHIERELQDVLKKHGVERFPSIGQAFDPMLHESVKSEQRDGSPPGTVLEEHAAGYRINSRIIRPAKVAVSE